SLTDKEIIGVQVVVTGSLSPISITQFILRTTGSLAPTADIAAIHIYWTGNSSTFAATNLFGSAAPANPLNNIFVNGTRTLVSGTNYFWVAYDLSAGAIIGHALDARCTNITVAGVNHVPAPTTPDGTRT